jgi:hypothetical protein
MAHDSQSNFTPYSPTKHASNAVCILDDSRDRGEISSQSNRTAVASASPQKNFISKRRRHSLLGGIGFSKSAPAAPPDLNTAIDPYNLINMERTRRSLRPYTRNVKLDAIAKKASIQLAESAGSKCSPTDFYGNVGKGRDILMVHQRMMAQRGTEKANIISSRFKQFGIGMATATDGQLYVCQLFL